MKPILFFCFLFTFLACNTTKEKKEGKKDTQSVLLRLQPKKGHVYNMRYSFYVENKTSGDLPKFDLDLTNTIEENTNEKIVVRSVYNNILMKGKLKGQEIHLKAGDSSNANKPDANMVAASVFSFLHNTVVSEYDGQFRKIKEIITSSDSVTTVTAVESKAQFIARYPEKELNLNDSWEDELEIMVANKKIEKATFTLVSVNKTAVELSIQGKIDATSEKFGKPYTIKGGFTGKVIIDRATGWQNNAVLKIEFTLSIDGKTIPMTQVIEYTLQ